MAGTDLPSALASGLGAKVGIVEDEILIADSIRAMLQGMHYQVPEPCFDYDEAIAMLHADKPDLVLLDINLSGSEQDGIVVARYIRENLHMPFIFLTANSDMATLARAKTVAPNAFLVKPFLAEDLYTAIEIAMHNFYTAGPSVSVNATKEYLFIKDGSLSHKVYFSDMLYLESDHVYVGVFTATRKYLVRTSLQQYMEQFDRAVFVRIHRSYVVNKLKVEKVALTQVHIGGKALPVSKKYREALLTQL